MENLESQGKSGNISQGPGFFIFQAFSLCRERAAAEEKTCLATDAKVEALKYKYNLLV